jgi:hypothetical protein
LRDFATSLRFDFMSQLQDLRRQIAQLQEEKRQWQAEQQELHEDKTQLTQENQKLREDLVKKEAELQALFRKLFGRSSERFTDDVDQLKFAFARSDEVDDAIEGIKQAEQENDSCEAKPGKKRRRREKLPEHLPREVVVIDLPAEEKAGLVCIGEDVTETLVFQRPQLTVIETHYPKYAKPRDPDQGIAQAARQAGLVEGNRYDTSIAAEVVTAIVRLPFADLSPRRPVCRQRLESLSQHAPESAGQCGKTDPAAG